jgi:hypothetical protein
VYTQVSGVVLVSQIGRRLSSQRADGCNKVDVEVSSPLCTILTTLEYVNCITPILWL